MKSRLILAALCVAAAACARPLSPPGGDQDHAPPRLVSVTPAALSVVPDFNDKVVFTFNETLSERGVNDAAVSVSPQPRGKVHVARKGNKIEVSAQGGWSRNQVYRVIVLPGVSDRFNNVRKDPVESVFSTGPPIQNTAVAGLVTDRISRRNAPGAVVEAVRRADSAAYFVESDTAGFFALRNIPAGAYDIAAFIDVNRNRRRDPSEASSIPHQLALGATDTIMEELVMLPADTTGPVLKRAESTDSLHVTISFDDPIDNEGGLSAASIAITRSADGQSAGVTFFTQLKNVQARADAANRRPPAPGAPDTTTRRPPVTRADSLAAADSARAAAARAREAAGAGPGGVSPIRGRVPADTLPVPDRDVVVTLAAPLPPGKYKVTVNGARNVNGLAGGGTAEFEVKAAPAKQPQFAPRARPAR